MPLKLDKHEKLELFAMIVDINSFTNLVSKSEGNLIAQFVRDTLSGGISSVEKVGGEVVGFMGDAFLGLLQKPEDVVNACVDIADDIVNLCHYISSNSSAFPFAPFGPSIKIGIEFGQLDISEITSKFLGSQKLFIGESINYASRILAPGTGNRCHFGPKAYEMGLSNYVSRKEYSLKTKGKQHESNFIYYELDLGDIWLGG